MKITEEADQQQVLADAHSYLDETGIFYFSTVQVETECLDTPGAEDIDIMDGSARSESPAHEKPIGHDGHHMH